MNSEEYPFKPGSQEFQTGDQPEQPPRWIHPDTLKFMGMAKELLDSPAVQQSIEAEWQKDQADSIDLADQKPVADSLPDQTELDQSERSPQLGDQPDTLNFMSMARDLLSSPAIQQSTEAEQQSFDPH